MRNVYVELDYIASPKDLTRTFSITPDATGEGRLMRPLKFTTSVRTWIQNESTSSGLSKIIIANSDGYLDTFANETFTECRIKEDIDGSTTTLVTGQIDRVVLNGKKFLEVSLKDATKLLDIPLQTNLFPASETSITGSGTNTYYALEGQPKPVCIGNSVKSIKPVLAKRSNNEYICHDEDIFAIQTVYDNGTSVSNTHYGEGFTLSTDPAGRIVARVRGQETPDNSSRIRDFDDIIDYLLNIRESISYSTTDATAITSAKGYWLHYYQDNTVNRTIREVIQWLCDSFTGWFYADESGDIRFGYLQEPAVSQDVDINQNNVIDGITVFDDLAPNLTTLIGGDRNWFVYNVDDIAAGVSELDRISLSSQWQTVAEGVNTIDSFYTDKGNVHDAIGISTDAQDEADNVTDLYSQRRKFYSFKSSVDAQIGETVELTYPRFGLDSGVNLLVLGREIDFIDNTYKLTLWG